MAVLVERAWSSRPRTGDLAAPGRRPHGQVEPRARQPGRPGRGPGSVPHRTVSSTRRQPSGARAIPPPRSS